MEISERYVDGILVLAAVGRMTIGRGDVTVREAVQKALGEGQTRIILDMKDVSALDSSGVGELVAQHVSARNRGGHLRLLHLSDRVGGVLKATRLTGILEIYDDEASALASFG